MNWFIIFVAAGLLMVSGAAWYNADYNKQHPSFCVEAATIKSIILVTRSSLIVQLDNGKTIDLNRINGAVGDNVCLRYERK